MRFMMIVKASAESEAGVMPTEEELTQMTEYNQELVRAGIMLAGEGLHPSSRAARVHFDGDKRTVVDGPFTETKELIAGFWLIQVPSLQDAVEWAKRIPFRESHVEIRQVFEEEDFGAEFTPQLREAEARMREQIEAQRNR